ncbi:hypothetical protein V6N11_074729 [Hibiscus sabdariffa]|uniref:RNase H type-1 domain-containing protein n=1 Tax=Hibiscus sabdariffa TaxID=183260 RepID=A0ABR2R4E7_9ROSI
MDGSQCYGVSKSLRGIRFGARSVPTFTKNNIEGPSVCPYGISKGYELSPADIDVVETDMGLVGFAKFIGVCSIVKAELWGIYNGLLRVWAHQIQRIIESDSLETLHMVQSASCDHVTLGLVLHIKELCSRNWVITFNHVRCKENCVADRMTRLAVMNNFIVQVFDVPPPVVEGLVLLEMAEEIVNNWGNSSLVQLSGLLFSFLESLVDRLRNYGEIFVFF